MAEQLAALAAALGDRYTIARELGAGGMTWTAVRRYGGTAEGGSDG